MEVCIKGKSPINISKSFYIINPLTAFIYFCLALYLVSAKKSLLEEVLIYLMILVVAIYFLGFRNALNKVKFYFVFAIWAPVFNILLNHRGKTKLFYMFGKRITLEAVINGFYIMFFLMSLMMMFLIVNEIITSTKLFYLFSKTAPQTAFIVNMTLNFSKLYKQKATKYLEVQKIRDCNEEEKNLLKKIKYYTKLLISFSLIVMEEGLGICETLRAKEYGKQKRTLFEKYIFKAEDVALIAFFVIVFASCIFSNNLMLLIIYLIFPVLYDGCKVVAK